MVISLFITFYGSIPLSGKQHLSLIYSTSIFMIPSGFQLGGITCDPAFLSLVSGSQRSLTFCQSDR